MEIDNRTPGTVMVIASPGRSVSTGNPWTMVWVKDPNTGIEKLVKQPNPDPGKLTSSEGEEIHLPLDEARRLASLGFVYFPDARPAFSRPLGIVAHAAPLVERATHDGPTSPPPGEDADLGQPVGITQFPLHDRARP